MFNRPGKKPAPVPMGLVGKRTIRYSSDANVLSLTYNDFLEIMFISTGSTVGNRLFNSMRLVCVEFYTPANMTAGTAQPISFSWVDAQSTVFQGTPFLPVTSVSVDQSTPNYFKFAPLQDTQQAQWLGINDNSSSTMFTVSFCPDGTIMDLTFEYVIVGANAIISPVNVQRTIAGATAGLIYHSNLPTNTTSWVPFTPITGI